jgi:threonine/homoserine/homoserine lactone efflux protein
MTALEERISMVSIFFLAFLPQFADPSRGPISLQLLLFGGVFIIATILVFGSIALLAGTLGRWLNRSPRVQNIMNRVAGIVFVCLALRLATTEQ